MKSEELTRRAAEGLSRIGPVMQAACDSVITSLSQFGRVAKEIVDKSPRLRTEAFCECRWSLIREGRLISLEVGPVLFNGWYSAAWVSRLYTPPLIRRRGYAREAMQNLCDGADDAGVRLVLGINAYGDMSHEDIEKFYCSFDFVKSADQSTIPVDDGLYVREPR